LSPSKEPQRVRARARVCVCANEVMGTALSSPETAASTRLSATTCADAEGDADADAGAETATDTGAEAGVKDGSDSNGVADTLFAIFREAQPLEERYNDPEADSSMFGRVVDFIVANFQPSPVMAHVELVVPPPPDNKEVPMNFATYIGEHSRWECASDDNRRYYLFAGQKWRAVPVHGRHAADLGRTVCNGVGAVPYSLTRYLTAAPGLRHVTSWLMPKRWERLDSSAQCATLVSRVIIRSIGARALKWSEAAYGPSTLYAELLERLRDARDNSAGGQAAAASRLEPELGADTEPRAQSHGVTFWIPDMLHESKVAPPPALCSDGDGDGSGSGSGRTSGEKQEQEEEARALRAQEAAYKLCRGSHDEVWNMTDASASDGIRVLMERVRLTAEVENDAGVDAQHELAHALLTWAMCRPSRPETSDAL